MAEEPDESTIGGRIRIARLKTTLSQAAVGRLLGVTREAVSQWEANTNTPTADKLGPLAGHIKTHVAYLLDGTLPRPAALTIGDQESGSNRQEVATDYNLDTGAMPRTMPVLGMGACGKDGEFELSGQTIDHVKRPPRLGNIRDSYALYVNGTSMVPWREPGDLVYVHPHAPVRINDYVVVQLKPIRPGDAPRAHIKRLVRRTAESIHLRQYNPRKEITIPASKVAAIHKVLDWTELLGL